MIPKKTPIRKCVACGTQKPKKEFIMIVRPPKNSENSNVFSADGAQTKEGRGAYLCKNPECLKKARKTRRFERIFSQKISDEIYADLEKAVLESNE